ncbi:STAS domain-containing protein [Streptomyces sp. NPDC059009]|uniref:STAS domain-containing protein n=1 Tax=Streptomyces sp. NPDC059009 TaxID=3346694 RepID=UPI0036D19EEB
MPREMPFAVDVVELPDLVLVRVAGDLDVATAPELARALTECEGRYCELDLLQVTFADSSALNLLTKYQRHTTARGGTLRLVDASVPVRRVLDITGTAKLFFAGPDEPRDPPVT